MKQFEDDAVRKSEGNNVFTLAAFYPCPEELATAGEDSTSSIGYDVFFAPNEPATLSANPTPTEILNFAVASGMRPHLGADVTPAERVLESSWVQEAGVTTVEELKAFLRKKDPKYEADGRRKRDNLQQYGCASWYDWSINNWGTKWDVDCTESGPVVEWADDAWQISYHFDSAWSPPIPAIKKISAIYTRLTFTLTYAEQGNAYEGRARFEDGVQTEDLEQEYSGELLERDYF